jgi:hypothetical protein
VLDNLVEIITHAASVSSVAAAMRQGYAAPIQQTAGAGSSTRDSNVASNFSHEPRNKAQ